jgi:transposase InsO family protein
LVINAEKCVFGVSKVEFLGHEVSAQGARPLSSHVAALQRHPPPTNIQQLQAFLGLVNFYRRFVKGAAGLLKPLTDCLRGGKSGKEPVVQSEEFLAAIGAAKRAVAEATLLAHPINGAEICLMVDASDVHVGASLQQRTSPSAPWQPLGFFSKKLEAAQQRYSAFDRELWACFAGIRHFRFMLEGRRFTIYTDHKPLTFALKRSSDPWTARQCRQLSYIAEYTSDIQHIAGKSNIVADTLSRPPQLLPPLPVDTKRPGQAEHKPASVKVPPGSLAAAIAAGVSPVTAVPVSDGLIDYVSIAASQQGCQETMSLAASSSLRIRPVLIGGVSLLCDWSSGTPRPLVPAPNRQAVFAAIHGLAHPGIRATRRLVAARAVWANMKADVGRWCRDCQQCSRGKSSSQAAAPVQPIPVPQQRFSHIHVDLVGPLPVSAAGYSYLFTAIDRSTRWLEAVPLKTMDAASCADALVAAWISRFGVPTTITSDRGAQFSSELWAVLCRRLGIQHTTTTAYHPQSNGMVERAHRQLKDSLRARLAGDKWPEHLPWVLLGLRAAPKDSSNVSSAELVYGAALTLPGQLLHPTEPPVDQFVERLRAILPPPTRQLSYAQAAASVPQSLMTARFVYVRRGGVVPPLAPLYQGPYAVLQSGPKFFRIMIGGKPDNVSVDRLKPHLGEIPVEPATPAPRGRPRKASVPSTASANSPASPPSPAPATSLGGAHVAAESCLAAGRNPGTR